MKRITLILATLFLTLSCGRYLSVQPQGMVIPTTDEEFAAIMHRIINDIEGGADNYVIGNMETIALYEGIADDLDANIMIGDLKAFAGDVINSRMTDYRESFEIIRDCNIVIDNLPGGSKITEDILAAAYAVKGICYYNLIRDFCEPWNKNTCTSQLGLPLVERFDISQKPVRSSLAQSVDYCESLLKKSLSHKMSSDLFFFTEYVVKAYLAKLYFWAQKWDEMIPLCEDIMKNSGISLCPASQYAAMMDASTKEGEVIVRSHINNASELDWYFSYLKSYISSRPACAGIVALYGEEKDKDVRYGVCFNSKRMNAKNPERRVRMSEILLMLAEGYYHKGEAEKALSLINELRANRIAGVLPLSISTLPELRTDSRIKIDCEGKAVTALLQTILDERRKELFMEGDRWFELKRNGRPEWWIINNGLKYTVKEYLYTPPIYKSDVDMDPNMKQNPGYGTK